MDEVWSAEFLWEKEAWAKIWEDNKKQEEVELEFQRALALKKQMAANWRLKELEETKRQMLK